VELEIVKVMNLYNVFKVSLNCHAKIGSSEYYLGIGIINNTNNKLILKCFFSIIHPVIKS